MPSAHDLIRQRFEDPPIDPREPERTKRLDGLLAAHATGTVTYIGPTTRPDGSKAYPVDINGTVFFLKPEEVLPALFFYKLGTEGMEAASRMAYRQDMVAFDIDD